MKLMYFEDGLPPVGVCLGPPPPLPLRQPKQGNVRQAGGELAMRGVGWQDHCSAYFEMTASRLLGVFLPRRRLVHTGGNAGIAVPTRWRSIGAPHMVFPYPSERRLVMFHVQ